MDKAKANRIHHEVWNAVIGPALKRVMEPLRALKKDTPRQLLHFTNAAALLPILRTGILRLSRARASNDPMELHYGLGLATEVVNTIPDEGLNTAFKAAILASFSGELLDGTEKPLPDPHVCCFSRPGCEKRIEHWALYGRGGSGFVLVLDAQALSDGRPADLLPVIYDRAEQIELLRAAITLGQETCQAAWDRSTGYGENVALRSCLVAAHAFGAMTSMYAATMKRSAFAFEEEWRILGGWLPDLKGTPDAELKFEAEAVGPVLRSYFEYPFKPYHLKAILVGAAHADLNTPVVKAMLVEYGYKSVEVEIGDLSLRTFTS